MRVRFENKGQLKKEFVIPTQNVQETLRYLQRNLPPNFEADYMEITNKPPKLSRIK